MYKIIYEKIKKHFHSAYTIVLYNFFESTFKATAILSIVKIVGIVSPFSILLRCPLLIPVISDNFRKDIFFSTLICFNKICSFYKKD